MLSYYNSVTECSFITKYLRTRLCEPDQESRTNEGLPKADRLFLSLVLRKEAQIIIILAIPAIPLIGLITWLLINQIHAKRGGCGLLRPIQGAGWDPNAYGFNAYKSPEPATHTKAEMQLVDQETQTDEVGWIQDQSKVQA